MDFHSNSTRAGVALTVVLALLVVSAPMTAATDAEELAQVGDQLVVGIAGGVK